MRWCVDILPDMAKRHRWDVTPDEAVAIQQRLRAEISQAEPTEPITLDQIHTVAGIDVSYREIGRHTSMCLQLRALEG